MEDKTRAEIIDLIETARPLMDHLQKNYDARCCFVIYPDSVKIMRDERVILSPKCCPL